MIDRPACWLIYVKNTGGSIYHLFIYHPPFVSGLTSVQRWHLSDSTCQVSHSSHSVNSNLPSCELVFQVHTQELCQEHPREHCQDQLKYIVKSILENFVRSTQVHCQEHTQEHLISIPTPVVTVTSNLQRASNSQVTEDLHTWLFHVLSVGRLPHWSILLAVLQDLCT